MLGLSYVLGRLANFSLCNNKSSYANCLLSRYAEHFYMLQINNKIRSELDYRVYDSNGYVITNELNRDYQLNKLLERLLRLPDDLMSSEIAIQKNLKPQS